MPLQIRVNTLLEKTIKAVYIIRDLSFALFFLTMGSLYPIIMYKFDVVFVPALKLPSYAILFLFSFFSAKTLLGLMFLFLGEIKHDGFYLNHLHYYMVTDKQMRGLFIGVTFIAGILMLLYYLTEMGNSDLEFILFGFAELCLMIISSFVLNATKGDE